MRHKHPFSQIFFYFVLIIAILDLVPKKVFAQTAADTQIRNIATVTFSDGTTNYSNNSNEVIITVAKVAGLTITPDAQVDTAVVPGQTGIVKTFRVTNIGNFTDTVNFGVGGTSLRVMGPAAITAATVAGATDILTNGSIVTQPLAQNGFVDVTVTLSVNASATAGSTIQVFLGDAASGTNFDNIVANTSANEVNTVSTGATNGSREARGDISFSVSAPNLALAKSHTGNFTRGSSGTYTFTATNNGNIATSGTITLTDILPTGLTVNGGLAGAISLSGTNAANWGCNSNSATPQVITCTSSTSLSNVSGSNTSTFSFNVAVSLSTLGSITNTATVSVPNESTVTLTDNTANDPTTVITPISCSEVYASGFSGGRNSLYRLNGSTMTAIYTAPQIVGGLAISSNGSTYYDDGTFANPPLFRFDGSNQSNTGMTLPTLNVGEAADAAGNVYFIDSAYHLRRASAGGSGAAVDLGALIFDADDTIGTQMRYGDMTFDGTGRLYWYGSINNGAGRTYLYVVDPTTLIAKSIGDVGPDGATGVAFNSSGNLITTRDAGATVVSINLGAANLDGSVIGTASPSVYDMGSCANPILNPNLINVSKSVINVTQNQNPATLATAGDVLEYTVVVNNSGNMPSYDAKLSDVIPAGTTYVADSTTMNGVAVADVSSAMPFVTSRKINSVNQPGGVIVATGNSTVKFRVTVNSGTLPATIDNTAVISYPTMSGGITTYQSINSNTTQTPTYTPPPLVTLVKSCPNPANCTTAPQLPGTDLTYKIEFTNSGGRGAANLVLVDGIPINTDYKIGSATANVATTGLTFLIEFSSDYNPASPSSATWTYTPVSAGGGASVGYDRNVKGIRWTVTSGTLSQISPNNVGDISFVVKIR